MSTAVDYDSVAASYASRYVHSDYAGVERALLDFLQCNASAERSVILDVGCGTEHWLTFAGGTQVRAVGLDFSAGMLTKARASLPAGQLVRARAEELPFRDGRVRPTHLCQRPAPLPRFGHVLARGSASYGMITF